MKEGGTCGREGCTEASLLERGVNDDKPTVLLSVTLSRPPMHLPLLFLQRSVNDDEPFIPRWRNHGSLHIATIIKVHYVF